MIYNIFFYFNSSFGTFISRIRIFPDRIRIFCRSRSGLWILIRKKTGSETLRESLIMLQESLKSSPGSAQGSVKKQLGSGTGLSFLARSGFNECGSEILFFVCVAII